MINEGRLTVDQLKARWALGELKSSRTSQHYCDSRVPALLQKLETATTKVPEPGTAEFRVLIEMFENARGKFLHMYINGINEFALEQWPVDRLYAINAMSQMDPLGRGRFVSVLAFALSPPPVGADDGDPRIAAAKVPLSNRPFQPNEPVIVGLYNSLQVLIDGYCRSILFMRSAGPQDRIPVLVPIAP